MKYSALLFCLIFATQVLSQTDFDSIYKFDGSYYELSPNTPFKGNEVKSFAVYEDRSMDLTIDSIANLTDGQWLSPVGLFPARASTYWIKVAIDNTLLIGNNHLFQVSPILGHDHYAYDFLNAYIPNENGYAPVSISGDNVLQADRTYPFWANLVYLKMKDATTSEFYIHMDGADRYFPMDKLRLWHIDPSTTFPISEKEAKTENLFFGALLVQFCFFMFLFFVEKEKIHLYYSTLIIGIFLTFSFSIHIYSSFVPFPFFKDYQLPIFFLGFFILIGSFLKFALAYFDYDRKSIYRTHVVPAMMLVYGLIYTLLCFYFYNHTYVRQLHIFVMLLSLLWIFPFFHIGIIAKNANRGLRNLFYLAFAPLMAAAVPLMGVWSFIMSFFTHSESKSSILNHSNLYDITQLAIVAMLSFFGVSIGLRKKILQSKKEEADLLNEQNAKKILSTTKEKENLKVLNKTQSQFYNNITHEFRTPLTVILGMNSELSSQSWFDKLSDAEKTKLKSHTDIINRNGNNLLNLINQLLYISKVEATEAPLNTTSINVSLYIDYLIQSIESMAQKKKITISTHHQLVDLLIDIDVEKLQLIIANLLTNAIKYSPKNKSIQVLTTYDAQQLTIIVKDEGVGIKQEHMPYIFDRFYQVDNSTTRIGEGTGIGLALVQKTIQLMGGKISVESIYGKGSKFILKFPLVEASTKAITSFESDHDELNTITADQSSKAEEDIILIVEDNTDVVTYLKTLLEGRYKIVTASNGAEGLMAAKAIIPDLILSDVMMPIKDGYELVKEVKADQLTNHIPVILLTAKVSPEDKMFGLTHGADGYITKPVNKSELLVTIENRLKLKQAISSKYTAVGKTDPDVNEAVPLDPFSDRLTAILAKEYHHSNFGVQELAEALALTYQQLNRKIKATTGHTPTHLMKLYRVNMAKELLKSSLHLNVSEIAFEVGYESPNYFIRNFSSICQLTPLQYRKLYKP